MRIDRIVALLVLGGLVASCGSSDPGPRPGVLNVTLHTPNTGDGAVMFNVDGGPVDSAAFPLMVIDGSYVIDGNQSRFALAGPITNGLIVALYVPDVHAAGQYVVTMQQAAANANFAQRSLAGYSMAVAVAP
jgi:hypothetical protein